MTAPDNDPSEPTTDRQYNRRTVVAALAATASVSLAGCSSDDSDGSDSPDSEDDESSDSDPTSNTNGSDDDSGGGDGNDGSDGPCPTGSFSYVTQEITTRSGTEVGSVEVPESARVEVTDSGFQVGGSIILEYEDGSFDSFGWSVEFRQDSDVGEPTVEDQVEAVQGLESQTVERTDSYDVASGGRVIATSEDSFPTSVHVIIPHPDGVLRVRFGTPNSVTCPDAAERLLTRLIESLQAI